MSLAYYNDESDKTSCPSDVYDEAYEYNTKSKSSHSKKKKPKRNRSAFIIFSSEMRTKLRSDDSKKLNSNEMMVKLAELWKNLSEDSKKKYYDQAEREKVRYHDELNYFYKNYPEEVIHNKTKKNHIKKPCSAYALYLKDMKQVIKGESPDLKMADILKHVAERWRNLSEDILVVYQRKALKEKEETKAKLNEAMNSPVPESPKSKKTPQSKKRSNPSKKVEKSGKDAIKVEATQTKIEDNSNDVKIEEPPVMKKQQVINVSLPTPSPNFFNNFSFANYMMNTPNPLFASFSNNSATTNKSTTQNEIEFYPNEFAYCPNPFSKMPSAEPQLLPNYSSRDESKFDHPDQIQTWNFKNDNMFERRPTEMIDLMNFQSFAKNEPLLDYIKREEDYISTDDDYVSSAHNLTPTSSHKSFSMRDAMNHELMGALETSDFPFDPLNLDNFLTLA